MKRHAAIVLVVCVLAALLLPVSAGAASPGPVVRPERKNAAAEDKAADAVNEYILSVASECAEDFVRAASEVNTGSDPDGVRLRKALAAQNIFVPTNWSYLISSMPEDSFEYEWSANILPLPIDQRYGEREMKMIADAIRAYDQENSL